MKDASMSQFLETFANSVASILSLYIKYLTRIPQEDISSRMRQRTVMIPPMNTRLSPPVMGSTSISFMIKRANLFVLSVFTPMARTRKNRTIVTKISIVTHYVVLSMGDPPGMNRVGQLAYWTESKFCEYLSFENAYLVANGHTLSDGHYLHDL